MAIMARVLNLQGTIALISDRIRPTLRHLVTRIGREERYELMLELCENAGLRGSILSLTWFFRPVSDVRTRDRSRLPGTALPRPSSNALLPFRSIYNQRALVPRAIILDG